MPAYLERARETADAVRDLPGVTVVRALAEGGLWTWERARATGDPGVQRVELSVGDATMALPVGKIRAAIAGPAG